MSTKITKALPFLAGFFILVLLAGFALGLRTKIEFDPINAQMKTSKYIYGLIPIFIHKQELWFSDGTEPATPIDWQLMHTFHQSAAGSKIEHSRWGSIADTIVNWDTLNLEPQAKLALASRTRSLITSDRPIKSIRLYILRIDARLVYTLDPIEHPDRAPMTSEEVDALFETALEEPLED